MKCLNVHLPGRYIKQILADFICILIGSYQIYLRWIFFHNRFQCLKGRSRGVKVADGKVHCWKNVDSEQTYQIFENKKKLYR